MSIPTLTLPEYVLAEEFAFDGRIYRDDTIAGIEISRSVSPSGTKVVHVTEYATGEHPEARIEVTDFTERDATLRLGIHRHREDGTYVRFSIDVGLAAARDLHALLGAALA